MTKIEALREYVNEYLDTRENEEWTSIDWLDNKEINFSITPLPLENNGLISRDILGNRKYMYSVMHSVVFDYSPDVLNMIENSDYFEKLEDWINEKNKGKDYPGIKGAYDVQITQSPYLFQSMPDNQKAQYTITITTYYVKEN